MSAVGELRNSKNLLERAAYWAATCSWITPHDWEDGQQDCKDLQEVAAIFDDVQEIAAVFDERGVEPTTENIERALELLRIDSIPEVEGIGVLPVSDEPPKFGPGF